jgi:hypothetical protein
LFPAGPVLVMAKRSVPSAEFGVRCCSSYTAIVPSPDSCPSLKGTPSEISREREYQAEANVVAYLKERFSRAGEYRAMPHPIREAIDSYSQGSLRLQ